MNILVQIMQGPLDRTPTPWNADGAGALICFEGIVRPNEGTQRIVALDYQAYEPMASKMLQRIGEDVAARHGLLGMRIEHSIGRVGVGACSFRLRVAAYHRQEALAALAEFIDRLKQDVPIWKTPIAEA